MKVLFISILALTILSCRSKDTTVSQVDVPKPIFQDPNYHGSCDPEIVFNDQDSTYYIYYTARRSAKQNTFLQTPIGVASSKDLANWEFKGYCAFDGKDDYKDASATYWAPAIISDGSDLHMFVTYKPDTLTTSGIWGGPGNIVHYKAPLKKPVKNWKKVATMNSDSVSTLDASVYKINDTYHLSFMSKSKQHKSENYKLVHKTTTDFENWDTIDQDTGDAYNKKATGIGYEEAPYIFNWKGSYWLLTDPHQGFALYKSDDASSWVFQDYILKNPGTGQMDNARARHGSVLVKEGKAFLVYHVEYNRNYDKTPIFKQALENRKSAIQMVELKLENGKIKTDRNEKITI